MIEDLGRPSTNLRRVSCGPSRNLAMTDRGGRRGFIGLHPTPVPRRTATETASGHPVIRGPSTRERRWTDGIGMSTVIDQHVKGLHFIAAQSPRHLIRLHDPPATGIMPKARLGVLGHPAIRESGLTAVCEVLRVKRSQLPVRGWRHWHPTTLPKAERLAAGSEEGR